MESRLLALAGGVTRSRDLDARCGEDPDFETGHTAIDAYAVFLVADAYRKIQVDRRRLQALVRGNGRGEGGRGMHPGGVVLGPVLMMLGVGYERVLIVRLVLLKVTSGVNLF